MARKKKHEEHENHERWLVSYADFITLLFAFFTVLYATSQADVKKQEQFQESFKRTMASFGSAGHAGGDGDAGADGGPDNSNRPALLQNVIDRFPPRSAGPAEVQDYVERVLNKKLSKEERNETISAIRHDTVGVRIQLAANKLFAPGSAELEDSAAKALDELGQLLKESNRRLIIEGHTDDLPIHSERYPSNWELSAARATKIVRYLTAQHQIPADRMTAVAYADQRPVVANDSPENRARNRRIEIKIITDDHVPEL